MVHLHEYVRGDMRRQPFRTESVGAAIMMDAFGFFDTEDEHEDVRREAARILTADGRRTSGASASIEPTNCAPPSNTQDSLLFVCSEILTERRSNRPANDDVDRRHALGAPGAIGHPSDRRSDEAAEAGGFGGMLSVNTTGRG
jgi:hypothetical protein